MKLSLVFGLAALLIAFGFGLYTGGAAQYLGSDPASCNNCHVMDAQYEGWAHGAHAHRAKCIDCHAPHALIPKYLVKAQSGINDLYHFALGLVPEQIHAKPETDKIIQANCIRCHQETVSMVADGQAGSGRFCFDCHRTVAHGSRGISLLRYPAQIQLPVANARE
jgi:cytochrome c nitrite reductase small subunit